MGIYMGKEYSDKFLTTYDEDSSDNDTDSSEEKSLLPFLRRNVEKKDGSSPSRAIPLVSDSDEEADE